MTVRDVIKAFMECRMGPHLESVSLTPLVAACYRELLTEADKAPPPEKRQNWVFQKTLQALQRLCFSAEDLPGVHSQNENPLTLEDSYLCYLSDHR